MVCESTKDSDKIQQCIIKLTVDNNKMGLQYLKVFLWVLEQVSQYLEPQHLYFLMHIVIHKETLWYDMYVHSMKIVINKLPLFLKNG